MQQFGKPLDLYGVCWLLCAESPALDGLQRKEKRVYLCVSLHGYGSLAKPTCIHIDLVVGKLVLHVHTHTHTGIHTVRSQLSTAASQLIKPNPGDWTEQFK